MSGVNVNDLKSRVIEACRRPLEEGMSTELYDAVVQGLRPSIRLEPLDGEELPLGGSRIGGLPDLPKGVGWPTYPGPPKPDPAWEELKGAPLAFLLQVNLAELASFDLERQLPTSGLLSFFYIESGARFGKYPKHGEICRVLYTPQQRARLCRLDPPANLPSEEVYRGFALAPRLEWMIPCSEDLEEDDAFEYWDGLEDEVAEAQGLRNYYRSKHRMLGYPEFLQFGDSGGGTWKLLLQLDSDSREDPEGEGYPLSGMCWGDGGRVYFGIGSKELAARNFDAVWAVAQWQ